MQNYTFPYQPMCYLYSMQTYTPYIVYPQQIFVQTLIQSNEQQLSNQNCFNIITKQHLDETKDPEVQDNQDSDLVEEDQDEKDQDYKVMYLNENLEKSNVVNQLNFSTNLQKNYTRAIMLYIRQQNTHIITVLGQKRAIIFYRVIKKIQNKIRNLSQISKYTRDEDFIRLFRILCNKFLRKDCVSYIYNSKIQQKTNHLKGKHIIKKNLFKI